MRSEDGHASLDDLADHLAGEGAHGTHLSACAGCRATLDELAAAAAAVQRGLRDLPAPAMPADVSARLDGAFAAEESLGNGASVTTLPATAAGSSARRTSWLAAAAGVAVLAAGVGTLSLTRDRGTDAGSAAASIARSSTGNNYARDRRLLTASLPGLLAGDAVAAAADRVAGAAPPAAAMPAPAAGGTGQSARNSADAAKPAAALEMYAAVDPLARLREPAGLASCLSAILPPEQPDLRPLALDYATFEGKPALVVVLPATVPEKVDVFVVAASCAAGNDATLFFTRLDRPR
ncbi:MAG TPA: hypothetical protein VNA30_04685 [Mycobacteriales bacterium]|nr:hypothetical protein [Mycobacteriales bacterium]